MAQGSARVRDEWRDDLASEFLQETSQSSSSRGVPEVGIAGSVDTSEMNAWMSVGKHLRNLPLVARCLSDAGKFYVRRPTAKDRRPSYLDHVQTVALMIITALGLLLFIVWLRDVLVPLVLAGFFMFQLEPVFFCILNPSLLCAACSKRARARSRAIEQERIQVFNEEVFESSKQYYQTPRPSKCRETLWKIHSFVALILCLLLMLLTIAGCAYAIFRSVQGFSMDKYMESQKFRQFVKNIKRLGDTSEELTATGEDRGVGGTDEVDIGALIGWLMEGPFVKSLMNVILSFVGIVFLMGLFLAFLLVSNLSSEYCDSTGLMLKARKTVRRYVRIKTQVSLAVSLLVYATYALLEVDLAFLFAFITFLLNYIPHIGYTISILLPLPLVAFDPTKTWGDFAQCLVWPTLIHASFSNFIEPRLLAKSLDLHPVVVLVSLFLWILCWGAVGAILAVPLTSIVRLILLEFDHPYAIVMVGLLEGQGPSSERKVALGPSSKAEVSSDDKFKVWMKAASLPELTLMQSCPSECASPRPSPQRSAQPSSSNGLHCRLKGFGALNVQGLNADAVGKPPSERFR